jgi:hypothetical protein
VTNVLCALLLGSLVFGVGCEPEMPMPPPRESTNPAEDDFAWAMERMEHAIERFQPTSSLGLRVRRKFDYELIPPAGKENYKARVTISTLTVYQPPVPAPKKEKPAPKRKNEEVELADLFAEPGADLEDVANLPLPTIPPAEIEKRKVPDPPLPTPEIKEEKDYLLEYVDDEWQLQEKDLDDSERMWFDYALQQGEFDPDGAGDL